MDRDILELKKAKEDLERIFDLSSDLICVAGMDGYFKLVNPSWEKILGYSKEELLSKPFLTFIHPEDHHKNDAEVAKLASGMKSVDFENRYIHKDGSVRIINWTAAPLPEEKLMYCIGRDITERKKIEEQLAKNKALLDETGRMTKVGGWEFDAETLALIWTKEVYAIHETDEASYKPAVESAINFYAPESKPVIQQAVDRAIKYGESFDVELQIITAKGNYRWVHAIGKGIKENNKIKTVAGTFQDITESKAAQEIIRKAKEELEVKVAERTKELSERVEELERYKAATVDRELRMKELRNEIERLKAEGK